MEVFGYIMAAIVIAMTTVITSAVNRSSSMRAQERANQTNLQLADKTAQANKELAEQEFEQNKQMWQMENEYNLPVNQMKRFEDAGLNPNLIYGQTNTSVAAPKINYASTQAPTVNPVYAPMDLSGLTNALSSISSIIMQQKQLKIAEMTAQANAQKTAAEVNAINQNTEQQGQLFLEKIAQERTHTNLMNNDLNRSNFMLPIEQQRAEYDLNTVKHNFQRLEFQDAMDDLNYKIRKWEHDHLNEKWTYEKMLTDSQVREAYFRCWNILQSNQRANDLHMYQLGNASLELGKNTIKTYNLWQYGQETPPNIGILGGNVPLAFPNSRNQDDFEYFLNSVMNNIRRKYGQPSRHGSGRSF